MDRVLGGPSTQDRVLEADWICDIMSGLEAEGVQGLLDKVNTLTVVAPVVKVQLLADHAKRCA